MPVRRAWRNLGPAGQIGTVATVAIVFVAVAVVAILGYGRSECVSQRILARNDTSIENLIATDVYSASQEQYIDTALHSKDRAHAVAAFLQLKARTHAWHVAVHAARVAAQKHPLGGC